MFKKPIKVGAQNQLSGKDRKTIKSKMSTLFNEKAVQTLFTQNQKIISIKVTGSKMLIYTGEEYPIFVDGTGKHDYFPTVYACQAFQPLMKYIVLNEGVETFIFNGANLMWPGVKSFTGLGKFAKDDVIGIKNAKGQIIAIGALGCSLQQLQTSEDKSGIAAYILHYKSDKLYDLGPKTPVQVLMKAQEIQQKQQIKKQQPIQQKEKILQKKPIIKQEKPSKKEEKPSKNQQKNQQKKTKVKQVSPPPKQQPQQDDDSDDQANFMGLLHTKGAPKQPVIKMQPKKKVDFDDFEDDDKGGKKKPKKGKTKINKKEDQDIMIEQKQQKPSKNKKNKGKNQDQQQQQQQIAQKQTGNKKKGQKKIKQQKVQKQKNNKSDDEQSDEKQQKGSDDEASQANTQKKQVSVISAKIMDGYLKQSFLNVLKLSKVQGELPIDGGKFYMDYMLLARPQGVKLQIKQSSYKKIGKFYQQMAKQKFIEFKHGKDKKGQQGPTISKIMYENQQLKNYIPTIKKMGEKDVQIKQQTGNLKAAKLKLSKTIVVNNVYKCSQELYNQLHQKKIDFLKDIDEDQPKKEQKKVQYFTEAQLKEKIYKYIQNISENKKDKKIQKQVIIDYKKNGYISLLLEKEITQYEENLAEKQVDNPPENSDEQEEGKKNKKDKKKSNTFRIDRQYLANKMMKKTVAFHHILDKENNFQSFRQGQFKGIQLFAEKANNKNITRILGLEIFIIPKEETDRQIHSLSQMFQQKYACSVNVLNLPGKNAGKQMILHGTFVDPLQEFFIAEGVKKHHITIVNKLDKKKKK